MGWKVLDVGAEGRKRETKGSAEEKTPEQILPVDLAKGQLQDIVDIEARKKKTRPPKRFTEGTLLTAMQTAGQSLDERELSDAMKETGLGTPATRAATIEVLLKRGYIVRTGKSLEATGKGIHLIEVVHPEVKSPAMTGQWEAFLKKIQHGECQLEPFLDSISQYVRSVVGKVGQTSPVQPASVVPSTPKVSDSPALPSPKIIPNGASLTELLQNAFGFSAFRPNQEAVCQAVTADRALAWWRVGHPYACNGPVDVSTPADLAALKADLEKAGERILTQRAPYEVSEELKLVSAQLQRLQDLPEDAEKIYKDYTGNLEGLKGKLQELQENKKLMLQELEERKKAWKNALQNLVDEVAPVYKQVLSTVGATGAIRLDEGDSIKEAGLQLLVGFKGAEPSILDPYTQSGGERSVALVAFMLSLQSRIISPLRAMDEFDIHMDPRNREAIFKMILAQGKRNPNSQHIVITPSIITVADRTAHVITVQSVHGSSQVKEYSSGGR